MLDPIPVLILKRILWWLIILLIIRYCFLTSRYDHNLVIIVIETLYSIRCFRSNLKNIFASLLYTIQMIHILFDSINLLRLKQCNRITGLSSLFYSIMNVQFPRQLRRTLTVLKQGILVFVVDGFSFILFGFLSVSEYI